MNDRHKELREKAVKYLIDCGYENIEREHTIIIGKKKIRVDVYGEITKNGLKESIVIECGDTDANNISALSMGEGVRKRVNEGEKRK